MKKEVVCSFETLRFPTKMATDCQNSENLNVKIHFSAILKPAYGESFTAIKANCFYVIQCK